MAIEFTSLELTELKPKVAVIGVGGAGGNAVNNMMRSGVKGVDFIAANTDAQALAGSEAKLKIQLGVEVTEGLGAGSHPDVGRAAAEEAIHQIEDSLSGCHMVFITAGMGGGTGTGAAPVIAKAAKAKGILTVAVVTKPFSFEGNRRMKLAEDGIYELQPFVDTLIVIPNQNLFRVANEKTTFAEAFKMADDVLCSGVRGITDLMMLPGLINLDFADIKTIMQNMGTAMMGTGEAVDEGRAKKAAEKAISNPLLDEMSLASAKGLVINITGGTDLTLFEVDEAANRIRREVDDNANIIVGSAFHEELDGIMRVSIVATGVTYLRKGVERPEPVVREIREADAGLHFEVEVTPEAQMGAEKTAMESNFQEAEIDETQHVGIVDDLANYGEEFTPEPKVETSEPVEMVETKEENSMETETFEEDLGVAMETKLSESGIPSETPSTSTPSYDMKEFHAENPSPFVEEERKSLFEESLEFVEDEEDPPLYEETIEEPEGGSLFQKMTSGIKGFFGYDGEVADGRAEPSMGSFEGPESDFEEENILPVEQDFDDLDRDETAIVDEEEKTEEDQLSIPSFLRKQA
ncbi:MAG: cell division protein FtsZ [Sphingomonadales bacterium]